MKRIRLHYLQFLFLGSLIKLVARLMGTEPPPVTSVAAIIQKGNKVLFLKHTYIDGFGLPGGMVGSGENLEQALKREVKEETGLDITSMSYFGSFAVHEDNLNKVSAVYLAKAKGSITSSEEGKVVWKEPEEVIDNLAYKDTKIALKEYLDKLPA